MTNKTPYEVRLDVMKMAKEMLDTEMQLNISLYDRDHSKDGTYSVPPPKMYTEDDLHAKSLSLYSFVDQLRTSKTK